MTTLRRYALPAYVVVLAVYVVLEGVPVDRLGQAAWIVGGIVAAMAGRPPAEHGRVLLDWAPFLAVLVVYDHTRGIADTLGMPVHVHEPLAADLALFGGTLPTSWLQEQAADPAAATVGVPWWDAVASLVYASHFVVPWLLAAVLYVRLRAAWGAYARRVVALSYLGLVTYVLYPAAPPWMAAQEGLVDGPVDRLVTQGWSVIGLDSAGVLLTQAQADVNRVAAVPSLHAAFALLVTIALWPLVRRPVVRALVAAYPAAMGLTLVYGGEHYVVDVLLGWVYVVFVVVAVGALERWWATRRESGGPPTQAPDHLPGPLGVLGPDQDPQPLGGSRNGGVHLDADQGYADRLGLGLRPGGGHRLEQPVVAGLAGAAFVPAHDGGTAAEGPPHEEHQDDEERSDHEGAEGVGVAPPTGHLPSVPRRGPPDTRG
ncbi:MAG TPA: phosphatase PAP2 family protein [Jiangellales bacterium]|nr:phosphatase PAP2 family protein [Jiangellales bacterium]